MRTLIQQHPLYGILGSVLSWLAVITGGMEKLESWVRLIAWVGASLVSFTTFYFLIKNKGRVQPKSDDLTPGD